ncbi:hypothetical protein BAE44_0018226 [Dichanthelium oligosanthes]|uniref:Myb-like domain-containing protein n=1 Tax=Dichanthelium oligosanthes TaxID=888268 RepID=A0A1E5V6Y5_9POAL|nr:hypothetical protein BAE44_0018226 [Dichanthelium oligosanthes]
MSSKIMITYKRKRVTSQDHTADDTVLDSSPAASSNLVASNLPPKFEAHAENTIVNEDNFVTPTKQQRLSMQQSIKEECEPERGQNELYGSLLQKEQPEIFSATIPTAEAHSKLLQCSEDTNNQIPVSSSVCDLKCADGTADRTIDPNTSGIAEIDSHKGPENTIGSRQCKNRFSPLLTFRRRVKKKIDLDESAEEICSPDNGKQCSTLTCSQPSSSVNDTPLLKYTAGNPLDTEDKIAEGENQNMTLENDGTPVSKFTGVQEVREQDARVEDSSKTSPITIEVPKVIDVQGEGHAIEQTRSLQSPRQNINVSWSKPTNKSAAEEIPESQGSTKNVPVIVLDDDSDERGKELENSEALHQDLHNQNKRISSGMIDLNCAELRQEGFLHLDDSSIQKLPDQDLVGSAQKQMSQPIERLFFTKEKDTIHGKQQQHEESSTMHTSYSNFFDLTPTWNTGKLKGPSSLPSELKFRIMDKAPEFSLDLSLDSFPDSSVSTLRSDKLFLGATSSISHKLTERLGTYSYKRHSALWSEEELDFLWIGVRRYGLNNWNAMLRDTRLRFSNSRMPEDLAKQWDKEQKKLLASSLGPVPPPLHIAEDYLGRASFSGCSKSPFLGAQTDLSLGDVYLRNAGASERGQHHLSSLGVLNLHGTDGGARNLSLGGFPGASSSYGRSGSRRRRTTKLQKSYYDSKSPWFQEPSQWAPQLFPMNQQPINSLPQWLTKDAETGTSRIDHKMWPSLAPAPGHSAADPPRHSLRADATLFCDDVKPHVLPDASLKRAMRNADWRSFSKRLFQTGDALGLNPGTAAAAIAGANGATPSDTGASSEETVSDS